MIERGPRQGQVTRYTYNANNQLVQVDVAGTLTRYAYDALGRRVSKQSPQGSTQFYWNGDVLLADITHSVAVGGEHSSDSRLYLFEPHTFKPLAQLHNGQLYHYHNDHLGTPREITNAQAEVVWACQFKAYGAQASARVQLLHNPLRFRANTSTTKPGYTTTATATTTPAADNSPPKTPSACSVD